MGTKNTDKVDLSQKSLLPKYLKLNESHYTEQHTSAFKLSLWIHQKTKFQTNAEVFNTMQINVQMISLIHEKILLSTVL